jgi:hypothetical protein
MMENNENNYWLMRLAAAMYSLKKSKKNPTNFEISDEVLNSPRIGG